METTTLITYTFYGALAFFSIVGLYKAFKKAGVAGWKAIVPVLNLSILFRMAGYSQWGVFFLLIPIANIYILYKVYQRIAFLYSRTEWTALFMLFLPAIGFMMLGFSKKSVYAPENLRKELQKIQQAYVPLTRNQQITRYASLVSILLLIGSGFAWWRFVYSSPRQTFYRMLDNSLKTQGVVRSINQEQRGSDGSQRLEQTIRLINNAQHVIEGKNVLTREDVDRTRIVTENVGNRDKDYIRYTELATTKKNTQGQQLDFNNYLNQWGESIPAENDSTSIYNQMILGIVPFANLQPLERKKIMDYIKKNDAFSVEWARVDGKNVNGRPQYTYKVLLNLKPYVTMLKQVASANKITQYDGVNPDAYARAAPVPAKFTVDVWSGQLVNYSTTNRATLEDDVYSFSSYGVTRPVEIPMQVVPFDELQSKLDAVSSQ